MHAVIEVDDAEGSCLGGGKLFDLMEQAWISDGGRCGHQVDIGDACELALHLGEIGSRNGVSEQESIWKFGVRVRRANFPGPLDLFGLRGRALSEKCGRRRRK